MQTRRDLIRGGLLLATAAALPAFTLPGLPCGCESWGGCAACSATEGEQRAYRAEARRLEALRAEDDRRAREAWAESWAVWLSTAWNPYRERVDAMEADLCTELDHMGIEHREATFDEHAHRDASTLVTRAEDLWPIELETKAEDMAHEIREAGPAAVLFVVGMTVEPLEEGWNATISMILLDGAGEQIDPKAIT